MAPRSNLLHRSSPRVISLAERSGRLRPSEREESGAESEHRQALARVVRAPMHEGNQVTVLLDGPATYEAMFEAIEAARDHINIESYIVEAEGPGEELARRLIARCKEGIKVNLLFDSFGSFTTTSRYFEDLRCAGVALCEFNPIGRLTTLLTRALHLRDHRKLMVVDGRVGFIGGVNISSVYSSSGIGGSQGGSSQGWRDTHVRIEGPVVADLQRLFMRHWWRFSKFPLQHGRYYPPLHRVGNLRIGVAATEAGSGRNPFYRSLIDAIDLARDRILLTSAYFVPTRRLTRALIRAVKRGVDVQLMLPGISDSWAALHAGRSHYSRLLRTGIRIHERQDRLLHAKTCVIDGYWSSVGSSNLDWRSILHNAEANIIVLDEGFADEIEAIFRDDVRASREMRLDEWRQRPLMQRVREQFARRFEFFL